MATSRKLRAQSLDQGASAYRNASEGCAELFDLPTSENQERLTSRSAAAAPVDNPISEESADELDVMTNQENGGKRVFFKSKTSVRFLVWIVKLGMLAAVLVCLVLSKLTVIEMTGILYSLYNSSNTDGNRQKTSAQYYWMLLLAVMIPNAITWIYTLFAGVFMNSTTQPWPSKRSLLVGIGIAILEAVAVSLMLFGVMPSLPPAINLFIVSGMFTVQGIRDLITLVSSKCCHYFYQRLCDCCWRACYKFRCCHDYIALDANDPAERETNGNHTTNTTQGCSRSNQSILSGLAQLGGVMAQAGGLVSIVVLLIVNKTGWRWFGVLVMAGILLLSFCWCDQVQRWTFAGKARKLKSRRKAPKNSPGIGSKLEHNSAPTPTARLTTSFITASVRLVLYPFITYVVFCYVYMYRNKPNPDPWGIYNHDSPSDGWSWDSHSVAVFLTHCLSSLLAYILSCFACYMTIHRMGLAVPALLSTPFSVAIYFISSEQSGDLRKFAIFPFRLSDSSFLRWNSWEPGPYHIIFGLAVLLWVGEVLVSAMYLLQTDNAILARHEDMFIRPHYNSIFLEQYLILNRRVSHKPMIMQIDQEGGRTKSTVFICSTMYRENTTEMTQMLKSIGRIAKHSSREHKEGNQDDKFDIFESHIFFDGGCKGEQPTEFAIQLLGLVPEALGDLGVKLKNAHKYQTPYGYRFTWYLKEVEDEEEDTSPKQQQEHPQTVSSRASGVDVHAGQHNRGFTQSILQPQFSKGWKGMPFVIHLKDNAKVKKKKRWSQVMYMKYIIEHRVPGVTSSQGDSVTLDNTYILTTDADIDFQAESALVLLDMLARDPRVGAVCARTHPLGYGPLYWYQIFDYAIGHWLLKAAEHTLGSVMCCPGCFSMFRCRALRDCLQTYSEEVNDAVEFLTKDMGEDRWLSTLLVKNGWRLEYCAISNDQTYCPNEFDEFFKQRRRWIPSTIANLLLLISDAKTFTKQNPSITYPFIFFQALIIFSTMISPATVILIMAYSLETSFGISSIPIAIILVLVSVIYGFVCVIFSKNQQFQLDLAKILTLVFSVIMAVVIAGLFKSTLTDIINFAFPNNTNEITTPAPIPCGGEPCNPNKTIDSFSLVNGTAAAFTLPISPSTIYLIALAVLYFATAILHIDEVFYIMHALWYFLGLPSGYLLLLIYSAANLNNRSWGTREKEEAVESMVSLIWNKVSQKVLKMFSQREEKDAEKEPKEEERPRDHRPSEWDRSEHWAEAPSMSLEEYQPQYEYRWLWQWLDSLDSKEFFKNFAQAGYTEEWYVAEMTEEDLVSIGVHPDGFVRHLAAAIKEIHSTPISAGIPKTVPEWIRDLKMSNEPENYVGKFYRSGYKEHDVENLSRITAEELKRDMEVTKPAHLQRFMKALKVVREATHDEERNRDAQEMINNSLRQDAYSQNNSELDAEFAFWMHMVLNVLRPIPEGLKQSNQLQASLRQLRNSTLIGVLLINIIWMTFLLTLTITQLTAFGLPSQVVGLLFLVVYGIIVIVQFLAMLVHRATTLAHYMARLNRNLRIEKESLQLLDAGNSWSSSPV